MACVIKTLPQVPDLYRTFLSFCGRTPLFPSLIFPPVASALSFYHSGLCKSKAPPFLYLFSLLLSDIAAMSSDTDAAPEFSELSSIFQRLLMRRDLSLFLPFVLGFTAATTEGESRSPQEPGQETSGNQQERVILINPFTQGMVVIEGTDSLDSLFRDLAAKNGQPPASKASIEAMPSLEISETEDKVGECAICLEEWELGGVVKEMPCKHRFHPNCIEKWLGMHGSCPVCRYNMPVDEEELGKKRAEGERRRLGREIWVSFSFNGNRTNPDSNQNPATDSNDVSSSSLGADHSVED